MLLPDAFEVVAWEVDRHEVETTSLLAVDPRGPAVEALSGSGLRGAGVDRYVGTNDHELLDAWLAVASADGTVTVERVTTGVLVGSLERRRAQASVALLRRITSGRPGSGPVGRGEADPGLATLEAFEALSGRDFEGNELLVPGFVPSRPLHGLPGEADRRAHAEMGSASMTAHWRDDSTSIVVSVSEGTGPRPPDAARVSTSAWAAVAAFGPDRYDGIVATFDGPPLLDLTGLRLTLLSDRVG